MIDPQVAYDKLAGFQTADEIADYFRSEQITGARQVHYACPIAQYMTKTTGEPVSVGTVRSMFLLSCTELPHTVAMVDFVDNFDKADYPDLIENIPEEDRVAHWEAVAKLLLQKMDEEAVVFQDTP